MKAARSLTWRTTWRFAALVVATIALVLAAGGWLLDRQMRRALSVLHEAEARELSALLAGAKLDADEVRARVLHDSEGDAEWFFIQIHDSAGRVLFRSPNLGQAMLPNLLGAPGSRRVVNLPGVGSVFVTEIQDGPWHIQVGSPWALERRLVVDYFSVSAWLLGGAALVAVGLGYGFSRSTLRPLLQMAAVARRVGADNLHQRVPEPPEGGEAAELARVLNQTFDRLEAAFEQVKFFAADASHELKTPLALMRLNAERLRGRLEAVGEEAGLDELLEAMARMQAVIDRLLFLARAESGSVGAALAEIDLRALLEDFAEDARALLEDAGGVFELCVTGAGPVRADGALLRQLLLNLVANAARVTPKGGRVRLDAERTPDGGWRLSVTDEGPGLPEAERERVFGRFVRLEGGDTGAGGGARHGLGLAICRSIARLHGGEVRLEARPDGRCGLRATVALPAS